MQESSSNTTRRRFLRDASSLAAGLSLGWPIVSQAATKSISPNDKLALGIIGAGGQGGGNLQHVQSERIIAFADVDEERASAAFKKFPKATRYRDFRKMLDKERTLDAVVISIPDHNHAVAAIAAMRRGLHVYCEKPLARTIYECRRMREVAEQTGVVSQMGQQGHALEGSRRAVEVIRSGAIGDVHDLHVWTDRPTGWWPQGEDRPTDTPPVPKTLDWDTWLGPAQFRPYHPAYVPFKWRGRWDFGTGPIGDMGVHNLDTAYWALDLGIPTSAEVVSMSHKTDDGPPLESTIEIHYPARGSAPPVKLTFYDGKRLPPRELFHGEPIADNGSLMIGTKGTLYTRTWHGGDTEKDMFLLLPKKEFVGYQPPTPTLPRVEEHHLEWINACKGGPQAQSSFAYASKLTEGLLVGLLSVRLGKRVEWDEKGMCGTGCREAEEFIRPKFRSGWEI
jgi:predicted dehydrogenase